jgi:hypothetical protein
MSEFVIPKPMTLAPETAVEPEPITQAPQKKEEHNFSTPAFAKAYAKAQSEFTKLTFDSEANAGQYKYKYASLSAVIECAKSALNKNGIALVQMVEDDALRTTLIHESGEFLTSSLNLKPFTAKSGAQGRGGAITYARRYALTAMLCVAAEEDHDAADANTTFTKLKK